MSKTYIGDVGTEIILDCGVDVSAATVRTIKALKPDGTSVDWTAVLEGTTAIKYTIQSGDLDQAGAWKLQAYIEIASWSGLGETAKLKVSAPFA